MIRRGTDHDGERGPSTRQFEILWTEDPPVVVYSNDGDNRAGWPTIVAFADAVVEGLGGGWVEP